MNEADKKNITEKQYIGQNSGLVHAAVMVILCFFAHMSYKSSFNTTGKIFSVNFNMCYYSAITVVGCVSYIVIRFLFDWIEKRKIINVGDRILKCIYLLLGVAIVLFICMVYKNEMLTYASIFYKKSFLRENINRKIFVVITILFSGIIYFICKHFRFKKKVCFLISIAVAFFCASFTFSYSVFIQDWSMSMGHMHAYTTSITTIARGIPFDEANISIYGHYGLLYAPIVHLLGNNYEAIAFCISFFTFITLICMFYVIYNLIESTSLYIISVLTVGGMVTSYFGQQVYYQGLPHRLLFPFIILALLCYFLKKGLNDRSQKLLLYVVCILSIIWNFETGIFCLVTAIVFLSFQRVFSFSELVKKMLFNGIISVLCILAAYGIVNIYNCITGGNWIGIKLFMYPIGSSYEISGLTVSIPDYTSAYIIHTIIFVLAISSFVYAYLRNGFCKKSKLDQKSLIVFCVAINGLLMIFYYYNRTAAANLYISHVHFLVILILLAEKLLSKKDVMQIIKNGGALATLEIVYGMIAVMLISTFLIEGIVAIPKGFSRRSLDEWNKGKIDNSIELFTETVPEGTLIIGTGAPELCFQLGWDPGVSVTDWVTIETNASSQENVKKAIDERNSFVIMYDDLRRGRLSIPEDFNIEQVIETPAFTAVYYTRVN